MLTYADVCCQARLRGAGAPVDSDDVLARVREAERRVLELGFTTQFTCFTRTKVQILTPEELRVARGAQPAAQQGANCRQPRQGVAYVSIRYSIRQHTSARS